MLTRQHDWRWRRIDVVMCVLRQVDGKNVYCKGTDAAARLIVGRCGSVCTMRFVRVEAGQRVNYTVSMLYLAHDFCSTSAPNRTQ